MGSTVCELLWISYLFSDFLVLVQQPIPFWCDNRAALDITANPVFHERTKHRDIDCHLVRINIRGASFFPLISAPLNQPVDLFTKALSVSAFTRLLSKLGLSSQAPSCGGLMKLTLPLHHCWQLPKLQSATTMKKTIFVH
ncbi:UNVERIFIED_CONTAM: hypothetical protein Slati_4491300 [Sesamum latifolium]|uniref:Uncharacterized protein n=1 Tax=Sesamum latifolium TaxID=2727402 RepID=A0AAW2SUN0_9LAMI